MLFVLEGIDGSGKSTLLQNLKTHLRADSERYAFFREPTRESRWGKKIRKVLTSEKEVSTEQNKHLRELYKKDRYWDLQNNIRPALEAKKTVFLDRYYFSTAAYQAKDAREAENIAQGYMDDPLILQPSAVFYLDIQPTAALSRILSRGSKKEIFEHQKTLELIHQNYSHLIQKSYFPFPVFKIDAALSTEFVFQNFWKRYKKLIQ